MKRIFVLLALCLLIVAESVGGQEVRRLGKAAVVRNPIRIVYFLDGVEEKDLEKFTAIAQAVNDSLMSKPPFNKFNGSFEAVIALTSSKQSGVTYADSAKVRETYFGSYFETPNYLKLPDWGEDKLVATRTRLYPDFNKNRDITVVMVNDPRYAGRTGGWSNFSIISYRDKTDIYVAIHEIGLQLGLWDERYFSYYPSWVPFPQFPNLIKVTKEEQKNISREMIPWGDMIDSSTPLPTPFEWQYRDNVGLFPVGSLTGGEFFAPQLDCIMRSSSTPYFCKVCQRHLANQIGGLLSLRPMLVGDFDGDGEVGLNDFFKFAEYFGTKKSQDRYSGTYDLDKDGEVGFSDFFIFVDHFGKRQ